MIAMTTSNSIKVKPPEDFLLDSEFFFSIDIRQHFYTHRLNFGFDTGLIATLGGQPTIASRYLAKVINILHSFLHPFSASFQSRNLFAIKTPSEFGNRVKRNHSEALSMTRSMRVCDWLV